MASNLAQDSSYVDEEGKEADISSVSRLREQAASLVPTLENGLLVPTFIVSSPVYSRTAFLDDFSGRSIPYTQAETTRVFRTCGKSSPLSKETARRMSSK